jgi:hypothetical protein
LLIAGATLLGLDSAQAQLPAAKKDGAGMEQDSGKGTKTVRDADVSLSVRVLWSLDGKEEPTAAAEARVQLQGDEEPHRTNKSGIATLGKVPSGKVQVLLFPPKANVCPLEIDVRPNMSVPVLLLTGTVGAWKTTVAWEINDVLAEREVGNAAVDLDGLVAQWPPSSKWNNDLMFECLTALWPIYVAHGSTHLVLARVLEDPLDLDRYRAAIPGADITVCRILAPQDVRVDRLQRRMPPTPLRDWHLHRTGELHDILERAAYEDFTVENGDRPVRDVALEVLTKAGWL